MRGSTVVESSSLVSILFREVFSHPYFSFSPNYYHAEIIFEKHPCLFKNNAEKCEKKKVIQGYHICPWR